MRSKKETPTSTTVQLLQPLSGVPLLGAKFANMSFPLPQRRTKLEPSTIIHRKSEVPRNSYLDIPKQSSTTLNKKPSLINFNPPLRQVNNNVVVDDDDDDDIEVLRGSNFQSDQNHPYSARNMNKSSRRFSSSTFSLNSTTSQRTMLFPSARPPTRQMPNIDLSNLSIIDRGSYARSSRNASHLSILSNSSNSIRSTRPQLNRSRTTNTTSSISRNDSINSYLDEFEGKIITIENWVQYKPLLRKSLEKAGMFKVLNGEIMKPIRRRGQDDSSFEKLIEDWIGQKSAAKLYLNACIGSENFALVENEPVEKMWKALIEYFEKQ